MKWGQYDFCNGCHYQWVQCIGYCWDNKVKYCNIGMKDTPPPFCKANGMEDYQLLKSKGLKSIYGKYKTDDISS